MRHSTSDASSIALISQMTRAFELRYVRERDTGLVSQRIERKRSRPAPAALPEERAAPASLRRLYDRPHQSPVLPLKIDAHPGRCAQRHGHRTCHLAKFRMTERDLVRSNL